MRHQDKPEKTFVISKRTLESMVCTRLNRDPEEEVVNWELSIEFSEEASPLELLIERSLP